MKRIIIICEGISESNFCQSILQPYFLNKGYILQTPLIKKSNGGIVHWSSIKKEIENYLLFETNVFVTTFFDYYGISTKHEFPQWSDSLKIADKINRMNFIENAMKINIYEKVNYKFIPYLQLHEFEALLFNNIDIFKNNIPSNQLVGLKELENILIDFPNPEFINDSKITSPSHRLSKIIIGYKKTIHGGNLAEKIGLHNIRNKCPRFNNWISTLENL